MASTLKSRQAQSTITTPTQCWNRCSPILTSEHLTLREVRADDAPALVEMFRVPEVSEYLSPPPSTVDEFMAFARWSNRERRAGRYLCLLAHQRGTGLLVGVFQVWRLDPTFATAEWGMAIARPFWGHGLFREAAVLFVDFAVETLGVQRLEARVAAGNHRGIEALAGLGAVREGLLRRCFRCGDDFVDHVMWSILGEDWRRQPAA